MPENVFPKSLNLGVSAIGLRNFSNVLVIQRKTTSTFLSSSNNIYSIQPALAILALLTKPTYKFFHNRIKAYPAHTILSQLYK